MSKNIAIKIYMVEVECVSDLKENNRFKLRNGFLWHSWVVTFSP